MKVQHIGQKNLINISRGELLEIHNDYQYSFRTSLRILLKEKIQKFYDNNLLRIQSALDKQQEIIKEFYLTNEQGVVQVQKKIGDEYQFDEKGNPVMEGALIEGKSEADFNLKMNEFMTEQVPMEL